MLKIGYKIKQARKNRHITQENLAGAVGVSDKSISAYELNRAEPPLKILEKIAEETGQPFSYFVEENPQSQILSKLTMVEKELEEIKQLLRGKNKK